MMNRINRDLIPIKVHYFFFNGATGPLMQFLPIIAKQLGFSASLVGKIYTILPISGLIAKTIFSGLANKFRLHKAFLITFQVILAISFFSINFIPEAEPTASATLICNGITFVELNFTKQFSYEALSIENGNKDNARCYLSCTIVSEENIKSLCESWHIDRYCSLTKVGIQQEQIRSLKKLEFEAQFNQSYDLKLANTLNIRVFKIFFANGDEYNAVCDKSDIRIPCKARCPKVPVLDKLIKGISHNEEHEQKQISAWNFQWFLWASVVSWIGMAVVVSIEDEICFDLLKNSKSRDYKKQQIWGSIGMGTFGISAGYLIDLFSKGDETKDYSYIFYIMLIVMIFSILVSTIFKKNILDSANEPSVLWELRKITKETRVLVFAWWCIGAGMCTSVVCNFLFWYTEEISTNLFQRDWIKTLQGLLIGVQHFLGEIPFNFISDNILRKVGHINVMSLVLLVYAIRFMAYSMISNVWVLLILEFLHGPSVGLCWPTMVSYGDKVAPSGTKATIQGLVGVVFEGIGIALGNLICGYLIDEYKSVTAFRVFSVGALVWLSIFWILQLLLREVKAYPVQQGHVHLASYTLPEDDAILMSMSQEMQIY